MARRCFVVSIWKLRFTNVKKKSNEKIKSVIEGVNKSLKKYASKTEIKDYYYFFDTFEDGDLVINIVLSKKISINTINNILSHMYVDTNEELKITYDARREIVVVSNLK